MITRNTGSSGQRETRTLAPHGVVRSHVVAAVRALDTRIADPWTLDALAEEVHLSRSQLARAFNATVGIGPMAYLRQMRVERMARLLISTDLSVAEAAKTVGWKNQFHASQCFHAQYGVSPTEYRHRQPAPPPDVRAGPHDPVGAHPQGEFESSRKV